MSMINKGGILLHENIFFGTLDELNSIEDYPIKKIPFVMEDEEDDK